MLNKLHAFALVAIMATGGTATQSCQTSTGGHPATRPETVASARPASGEQCLKPGAAPGTYGGPVIEEDYTRGHLNFRGTCDHCGNVLSYEPRTDTAKRGMEKACQTGQDFEDRLGG